MNCYFSSAAEWVPSVIPAIRATGRICTCCALQVQEPCGFGWIKLYDEKWLSQRSDCELMTCILLVVQPCVLVNVMMGWEKVDRKDTSVFSDSLQFNWARPVKYPVKQIHTFCGYFCVWKKVLPCLSFSEPAISKENGNTMPGTQVGLPRPMACLLQNEAVVK